ncbi:hypothetical protein JCM8097_003733, partial [Rhodosporidiobolus ruineniae]
MAPSSPFQRRPALTRTYGHSSRRTSHPPNSHQPTRNSQASKGRKSILDDTDSEEEEQRVAESLLSPKQLGKDKTASTSSRTVSRPPPPKLAPPPQSVARPAPARRTRSSTAADLAPPVDASASAANTASPEEENKGSTVWDESAAVRAKPSSTKARATRRTSVRNGADRGGEEAAEASSARGTRSGSRSPAKRALPIEEVKEVAVQEPKEDEAPEPSSPPSRRKRTRLSLASPAALPTATGRAKGKEKEAAREEKEDEDAIPAPIKYVPLSVRLKEAKKAAPPPAQPAARAASPRLVRARSTRTSSTAVSAPPAKIPSPAPPAPTVEPPKPSASISTAAPPPVPATKRPAPLSRASSAKPTARPAPPPAQPPSPAKDLSSLFSRFSSAAPAASTSTSTAPSAATKMGLKRSASALDAPGGGGGVVGRMKAGRKATVDDKDKMMEVDEDSLSTGRRSPFPSPSRPALHPSHSFPVLPSSPTRSPLHSPRFGSPSPSRPPLGSSLSFPVLPGRAESPTPSSPGASPRRRPAFPARASSGPSGLFPSYGLSSAASGFSSAFRAAAPAGAPVAGGPTRTYAGGGRTFRRDVDEEALFAAPSTAVGRTKSGLSAVLEASSSPSGSGTGSTGGLPALPPSLRRPLLPAAPTAPRETYASLRHKWGIDAEESLNAEVFESQESQERGGRVEGGETLRKRGEGKRWGDEVGFLLEGLKDGREDEGAARASALDLLRKLLDRDWLRRLKASGMAEQVYLAVRRAGAGEGRDRVLDTALAILLALLLRDQRLSEPLLRLSPADLARSSASSSSPRKRKGSGLDSPAGSHMGSPAALSRQNSYGFSQSQGEDADPSSSFPSFSSSPRKPLGGRDSYPYSQSQSQNQSQSQLGADLFAAALDDRCDVLEVLKAFLGGGLEEGDLEGGGAEWGGEEIGLKKKEEEEDDGGKGKGKKAARRERGDGRHLQALRDIIDESELFAVDAGLPVTLHSLALHALRSVASYTARAIFQPQQLLCVSGAFALVVRRGLVEECEKIGKRVEGFEKGLDLLPPASSATSTATAAPSVPTLLLTLSTLELTSASSPLAFPCLSAPHLLPLVASSLSELTLFAQLLLFSSTIDTDKEHGRQLLVAALGALYGLTTEAEWSAALVEADERKGRKRGELVEVLVRTVVAARKAAKESIATAPKPKKEAEDPEMLDGAEQDGEGEVDSTKQQLWDILSLSLGVLANVLDSVGDEEGVKEMMREMAINPSCTSRRRCTRTCSCAAEKKQPLLKILASLACDPMSDAPNTVRCLSLSLYLPAP